MTIRERVKDELLIRLSAVSTLSNGSAVSVPVRRGWTGVFNVPEIYVFLGRDQSSLHRHGGPYEVQLPISVEYYARTSDDARALDDGERYLFELRQAIELDERFTETGPKSKREDLATSFWLAESEVMIWRDRTVAAIVEYTFRFIEPFLGYEPSRH